MAHEGCAHDTITEEWLCSEATALTARVRQLEEALRRVSDERPCSHRPRILSGACAGCLAREGLSTPSPHEARAQFPAFPGATPELIQAHLDAMGPGGLEAAKRGEAFLASNGIHRVPHEARAGDGTLLEKSLVSLPSEFVVDEAMAQRAVAHVVEARAGEPTREERMEAFIAKAARWIFETQDEHDEGAQELLADVAALQGGVVRPRPHGDGRALPPLRLSHGRRGGREMNDDLKGLKNLLADVRLTEDQKLDELATLRAELTEARTLAAALKAQRDALCEQRDELAATVQALRGRS